jgi:hypothetical protein
MAVVLEFDTHKDPDDKTRNQVALMEYIPASGEILPESDCARNS